MKILYAYPYSSEFWVGGEARTKDLRRASHDVLLFDERAPRMLFLKLLPFGFGGKVRKLKLGGNLQRFRKSVKYLKNRDNQLMNRDLIKLVSSFKPDLLLVEKGTRIKFETIHQIRHMGVITANWYPDNLDHLRWMKPAIEAYDYFFHFDSYVVSLLRESGSDNVYHLPCGCDIESYKTLTVSEEDRKKYGCDVCFVGNYSPDREELLLNLTEFDLKVWGDKRWQSSRLSYFYQWLAKGAVEIPKIYNCCKIAINYHYKYTGEGANLRTFEIAGCGGALQIVDYRKDIVELFEEGKEIIIFRDVKELRGKVEYYLKNEEERKAIAKRCQQRAYKEHTLEQRTANLIGMINRGKPFNR